VSEELIHDISQRLAKIEDRLTKIEVAVGKLETGQRVSSMIAGGAIATVGALLVKLLSG
tara:strand:- start:423 stop:599 length:177 start_codon:yes stop_codon:yes gene_type:complete